MPSKDPFVHLDELIGRAAERVGALLTENLRLGGKVRELEAEVMRLMEDLDAKKKDDGKTSELEEKIVRLEKEREEVRKKVESASARLRKMIAAATETKGGEISSDSGDEPPPAEPEELESTAASEA